MCSIALETSLKGRAAGNAPAPVSAKRHQLLVGSLKYTTLRPAMRTVGQPTANQLLSPAASLLEALSAPAAPHHLSADMAATSDSSIGGAVMSTAAPLSRAATGEDEGGWMKALGSNDSQTQPTAEQSAGSPLPPPVSPSPLDATYSPAAAPLAEHPGWWHSTSGAQGQAGCHGKVDGAVAGGSGVHPPSSSPFTMPVLQTQVAHATFPYTNNMHGQGNAMGLRTHHSLHQPMVATTASAFYTAQPQRAGSASHNGLLPHQRGTARDGYEVSPLPGSDPTDPSSSTSRRSHLTPSTRSSLHLVLPPAQQPPHQASASRVPRISEDPLSPTQVVATLAGEHAPVTRTPGRPLPLPPPLEPTLSEDLLMMAGGPSRDLPLLPDPCVNNSNTTLGRPSSSGLPLLLSRFPQPSLDILGDGSTSMSGLDEGMIGGSSLLSALSPQATLRSMASLPHHHAPSAALAIPSPPLTSSPWGSGTAAAAALIGAVTGAPTAAAAAAAGPSGPTASAAQALIMSSSPRTLLGGSPLGAGMSMEMSTWMALERASSLKLHTSMSVVSQQPNTVPPSLLVPGMVPVAGAESSSLQVSAPHAMSPPHPSTSVAAADGGSPAATLSAEQCTAPAMPRYCPNCTMPTVRSAGLPAPFCTYCGHQASPASTAESAGYSSLGGHSAAAAAAAAGLPPPSPHTTQQPAPVQRSHLQEQEQGHVTLLSYDDRMLAHCELPSPWGREHPERPARLTAIMRRLHYSGVLARCQQITGREASVEELVAVHDPQLVKEVHAASLKAAAGLKTPSAKCGDATAAEPSASAVEAGQQQQERGKGESAHDEGGGADAEMAEQLDALFGGAFLPERVSSRYIHDCPINGATYESARVAAGSAVEVAVSVARGTARNGAAIIRPPGHHAESGTSLGFCLFNNAAVAARAAQKIPGINRVLIMDWDVHHGNGTEQAFFSDKSVMYMSTHRYDDGMYYPGTGAAGDVGAPGAEGYNVNVPFNGPGVQDADILAAFRHVILPIAQDFKPDLVIVSAGFDAADGDPLGECHVTPACFGHLTAMLASLGPIVLLLEGGYNLEATAASTEACVRVLLGEPPVPLQADQTHLSRQARAAITAALDAHRPYWSSAVTHLAEVQALPSPPSPSVFPVMEDEEMSMSGMGLMDALVPGTSAATMTAAALALSQDVNGGLDSLGAVQHGSEFDAGHSSPSAMFGSTAQQVDRADREEQEHDMEDLESFKASSPQVQQSSFQRMPDQGHHVQDSNNFAGMDWAEGTHGLIPGSGLSQEHDGFDSVQWGTA